MTPFAVELRRALTRNGTTTRATAAAVGIHEGTLGDLALGRHRPGLDVAARLAEVLGAPNLSTLATEARTKRCAVCDRAFVDGTKHFGRRFCSQRCSRAAHARSQRKHYTHKRLGQARLLQNRMEQMAAVIAAFCRDCTAGESICRDDECLLRPVSPLPFIPLSRVSRRAA